MSTRTYSHTLSERILTGIGCLVALSIANLVQARSLFMPQSEPNRIKQPVDQAEVLQPLRSIEQKLGAEQRHDYLVPAERGIFFRIDVEQRGIDLLVELYGPQGEKLAEVDSPNGISGLESVVMITEAAGTYRISVRSLQAGVAAGSYRINLSQFKPATDRERRSLALYRKYRETLDRQAQAQVTEAEAAAAEALKLAEGQLGREHPETALIRITLAEILRGDNRPEQAEALFRQALEVLKDASGVDRVTLAQAWEGLGTTLYDRRNLPGAEECYRQAIAVREGIFGPDSPDIVVILGSLALIYLEQGELRKAETYFSRAWRLYDHVVGTDNPAAINFLNNYAGYYCALANYPEAERLYQRALSIQEKLYGPEEPAGMIGTLDNLAGLYYQMGDTEKSGRLREEILNKREKIHGANHPMVALASSNLGIVFLDRGDLDRAERLFKRALAIYEAGEFKDHPVTAIVLINLGEVLRKRADLDGAERLYRRALAINRKAYGDRAPEVARALSGLADVAYRRGDLTEARSLEEQSLRIEESVFGLQHRYVLDTLAELASLNQAQGQAHQAVENYGLILERTEVALRRNLVAGSERQKLAYLATFADQINKVVTLHTRFAPADPQALNLALASILRLKGRGLDEIAGAIMNSRRRAQNEDEELLKQWLALRSQLSSLALKGPADGEFKAYAARRREAEEQLEKTEAELSIRNAEFRLQTQPVTPEAVQKVLPPGTSLIEYVCYRPYDPKTKASGSPRYIAYVVNAEGPFSWADLGEASIIDRAVEQLRAALRDRQRSDIKTAARRLDRLIMQPLRATIEENARILISPDGQLNLVPFAALADRRRRWLVERYSFSYLTSGRDLLKRRTSGEPGTGIVVVADPAFGDPRQGDLAVAGPAGTRRLVLSPRARKDGSKRAAISFDEVWFERLPGTAREAGMLRKLMPDARLLTGTEATKSNLSELHRPLILHIATHGFFLTELQTESGGQPIDNPLLRSGLALAGANLRKKDDNRGVLTALEAAGLDLWGTKLVVLSACDTGVGEIKNGDGVYGLRRALVLAGSETQIMTLWPVSDSGTEAVMTRYYRRLLQGAGRGEALREAQLQIIRDPQRRHPFYWAGFIQSGEWDGLNGKGKETTHQHQ
ncbi:MAG TPA: CHAT domain-containing protein [Blastocatellia bacterium]|nr:CHAT domain-containing protein [Blastocatellia bacterium]